MNHPGVSVSRAARELAFVEIEMLAVESN